MSGTTVDNFWYIFVYLVKVGSKHKGRCMVKCLLLKES